MATFQIHEDIENRPFGKKNFKVAENPGKYEENRKILQPVNFLKQDNKRIRLDCKENIKESHPKVTHVKAEINQGKPKVIKKKIVEEVVLDEELFAVNNEETPVADTEIDTFPVTLLKEIEYRNDIWEYLTTMEVTCQRTKSSYMAKQQSLNWNTRSVLVDWLASVADEYDLNDQTFHLGINYIDRFLGRISVVKEKFQLVGAAAMMLAGKVEEIYPIETSEWSFLTGDSFTKRQILKMEQMILKVLLFNMQPPTICSFIEHLCTQFNFDAKTKHLAMFLGDIMLLEGEEYLDHLPSKLAAASIALARYTLCKSPILPKKMQDVSGYSLKTLSPVVQKQNKSFRETPLKQQQAIQSRYKSERYDGVANLKPKVLNLSEFDDEE
ncbi:unnamed protein product [Brassicogethes aeneus]|uniref:Uncharacterized protein n=1 Tax=Brassicogethes aeneus TaxID=1431903 RepID=A0A9P0BJP2_BRAAE|nr:unnamed protein product [Brassicogethes aeneus]